MTRQSPADLIRGGKLPEKDFPVCVDPDLVTEYERLVGSRDAAKQAGKTSLAGAATAELDDQIAAIQSQMDEKIVVLRLRALSRRRWAELKSEHLPRRDEEKNVVPEDLFLGVNSETFFEPLIHESIVGPELDAETVQLLIDEKLTDAQWNDLTTAVWNLNEKKVSVPFSLAASPNRKTSGSRSKRPNASA